MYDYGFLMLLIAGGSQNPSIQGAICNFITAIAMVVFCSQLHLPTHHTYSTLLTLTQALHIDQRFHNCHFIQVGTWNDGLLNMTREPVVYVRPGMTEMGASHVTSSCDGSSCTHVDWWLYDVDYVYEQLDNNTTRTVPIFLNMYSEYLGDGKCKGKL